MTVLAAVHRIHLCGDPTFHWLLWPMSEHSNNHKAGPFLPDGDPSDGLPAAWLNSFSNSVASKTLLPSTSSSPPSLVRSDWHCLPAIPASCGSLPFFPHSLSLSLQIPLHFPASASWRVWINRNWYRKRWLKTSVKMEIWDWLTHPWWVKRIPSWVEGGAHIVSDTRWWPSCQRFHYRWPGNASPWSEMPLQLPWFRMTQSFWRYGKKNAYKDSRVGWLLLNWLALCREVRN